MNPLAAEWASKAEGDHASALRELRARKDPNYDAACFHAQQSVEKYLKAILQAGNIPFTKTHDLCLLLDSCIAQHPLWDSFRPELEMLTQYAVAFRYPGETATKSEARQAVDAARKFRREFRLVLNLKT